MVPAATDDATWRARPRTTLPWLVLAAGITASVALFTVVRDAVENVAQLRFERQAIDAKAVLEHRINFYADVLYGLKALFSSQHPVTRLQFRTYVNALNLRQRYPGFDVVNYAMYVPGAEKREFEEAVRRDTSLDPRGYPQFAVKPPGERAEYHVVVYVEPMRQFEFAFGLDLGANPAVTGSDSKFLTNLQHAARDSGELTTSGRPIRIKAAKEYVGLALRLAVYRSGMPVDTVAQRRAAYLGSVGAGFNVENLMSGVVDEDAQRQLRFRVYDAGPAGASAGTEPSDGKRLLFDSTMLDRASPARREPHVGTEFIRVLPMEIGGRTWEVHFAGSKDIIIGRVDAVLPWMILTGGILSSALLFGMFYSLASSRTRAVEIAREITRDLRESEKALQSSAEQLQAMSRRLVEVQESERRELARELHDRVGQDITALSISLDILRTQLAGRGGEAVEMRLDDASALLDATAGTVENVMSDLRPPMLDDYGLLPALQWYATVFSGRTGIAVGVTGDEAAPRLPPASEIALFRIVQEALNNVAKHAHAGRADIALERSAGGAVVTVTDDGVGLAAAPAASPGRRHGLGMLTMRERTQAVGGSFGIGSAPGGGTRVTVRVPC